VLVKRINFTGGIVKTRRKARNEGKEPSRKEAKEKISGREMR